MLQTDPFRDQVENFNVRSIFSEGEKKPAAKIMKLQPVVRLITDIDYIIVVKKPMFEEMTVDQQGLLLVHEIHHIQPKEKDGETLPSLRPHNQAFCTFLTHNHENSEVRAIWDKIKEDTEVVKAMKALPHAAKEGKMDQFLEQEA